MPRLSDSMEEGTIAEWLKQTGDPVQPGDAIVEIETDKATMEYEADEGGVLEVVAPAGTTVPLGAVIARLLPEGTAPGTDSPAHEPASAEATAPEEREREPDRELPVQGPDAHETRGQH